MHTDRNQFEDGTHENTRRAALGLYLKPVPPPEDETFPPRVIAALGITLAVLAGALLISIISIIAI